MELISDYRNVYICTNDEPVRGKRQKTIVCRGLVKKIDCFDSLDDYSSKYVKRIETKDALLNMSV